MTTYAFSSLSNNQRIPFDPLGDVLSFGSGTASSLRLTQSGQDLQVSFSGKTVILQGLTPGDLAVENIEFSNGSGVLTGDGTVLRLPDWYGQYYDLADQTVGNFLSALGGSDVVEGGKGADWIVGNTPFTPLNHVNRIGSTGSPTSASDVSISADGRFVAFYGGWTEFGSSSDSAQDVFVKDMTSGAVNNEHVTALGEAARSGSGVPVISADGQWLVFLSSSGLVEGNPPSSTIYRSSTTSGDIDVVSVSSAGAFADRPADNPDVSADGRFVVFESWATNFNGNGDAGYWDIYLKDMENGQLTRLSTSVSGGDGNGDSRYAQISADGRFVVFQSAASNLTAGDTNGYMDIFLWDREDGSLTNLTGDLSGKQLGNEARSPDVAFDNGYGGVVVFETGRQLVEADDDGALDIYAINLSDGSVSLVSSTADGSNTQVSAYDPAISGDGRYVVFTSNSEQLVPGDTNGYGDVFVKDLFTGAIALVSKPASGGEANQASSDADISLGGDWIVFESSASNLASSDGNAGFPDVFRVSNPLLLDELRGGPGNDTYVIQRASDVIEELAGAGIDTVQSSIGYTLGANLENLVLSGSANIPGTGNALNNVITGNAGNNAINGGGGKDTASYASAAGAVTVSLALTGAQATGAGSDTLSNIENLTGSSGADRLTGNSAANRLDGGLGNDTLAGGGGDDTLVGSEGSDALRGDAGADTFVFNKTLGSDTVADFLSGTDDLQFSMAAFRIGDGDTVVEGALTRGAPGGFGTGAELVIFSGNAGGSSASSAAAAIGSANANYRSGDKRIFVTDDGSDSSVWLFTSSGADALVSASELKLIVLLDGTASTVTGDYLFAG